MYKERIIGRLARAHNALANSGITTWPDYIKGSNHFTAIVGDIEYTISSLNAKTFRAVGLYHQIPYSDDIQSKKDAIKTGKDLFEFCHELQIRNFSKMDEALESMKIPRLSLYYRNESSKNRVIVTATQHISLDDMLFRGDEILSGLSSKLQDLTKLIAVDNAGAGKRLRWERPVRIGKNWWRH